MFNWFKKKETPAPFIFVKQGCGTGYFYSTEYWNTLCKEYLYVQGSGSLDQKHAYELFEEICANGQTDGKIILVKA